MDGLRYYLLGVAISHAYKSSRFLPSSSSCLSADRIDTMATERKDAVVPLKEDEESIVLLENGKLRSSLPASIFCVMLLFPQPLLFMFKSCSKRTIKRHKKNSKQIELTEASVILRYEKGRH